MGNYDCLPGGSQVKLWESEYRTLKIGSKVTPYYPEYIVLLHEGGYVRVSQGIITEIWEDEILRYPKDFDVPCLSKWGEFLETDLDLEGIGIMGEHYYEAHKRQETKAD